MSASVLETGKKKPIYKTLDQVMDQKMAWRCASFALFSALRILVSSVMVFYFVNGRSTTLYPFIALLLFEILFSMFEMVLILLGGSKGDAARMVSSFTSLKKLPISRRFAFITHNKPFADWHLVVCGHLFVMTVVTVLVTFIYIMSSSDHFIEAIGTTLFLTIGLVISYLQLNSFYSYIVCGSYWSVINHKTRHSYGQSRAADKIKEQYKRATQDLPMAERRATIRTEKNTVESKRQ